MRAQLQRGPRQEHHPSDHGGHRNRGGRQTARRRSGRGDQPYGRDFRRRAGSGGRGGVPRRAQGCRADRHAQPPRRASPHGRHRRAALDSHRRHHARRVRRPGPQAGRAHRRRAARADLLLRGCGLRAGAPQPGRLPQGRVRGAARAHDAQGGGARLRCPRVRRGCGPHGRYGRRGPRLPDRRELQPQHHLHAPRQRHCVRRA